MRDGASEAVVDEVEEEAKSGGSLEIGYSESLLIWLK